MPFLYRSLKRNPYLADLPHDPVRWALGLVHTAGIVEDNVCVFVLPEIIQIS
jgi:hypothetical protein